MRGQNKDKITETSFWTNFPNKWPQVLDNETNEIASQKKTFFFFFLVKKIFFSTHNLSLSKHLKHMKHFVASQYASTLFCTYHTRKTSQTFKRLSFKIQTILWQRNTCLYLIPKRNKFCSGNHISMNWTNILNPLHPWYTSEHFW